VILTAGLSPAWQQVLLFDSFTPGEVNRAREVHWCASGKVLNSARALHHLGAPCKALTVTGGPAGRTIREDFARLGIPARWVETATPTRTCTTILDAAAGTATELVPNAGPLGSDERDAFVTAYAEEAAAAEVVVLIGSLPAQTPAAFYRELLSLTPGKVVLDARGPELLEALHTRPFLVKPNRSELGRTLGRELRTESELFDGMRQVNERGAEWVVITDGGNPVYACSRGQHYRLRPPARKVVNPIGCGDCMAAGIACAVAEGRESVEAIRYGLAVAASKAGQVLPGLVDPGEVEERARAVDITRVKPG
jgi:1-phosphofructokinase family hexose kinase